MKPVNAPHNLPLRLLRSGNVTSPQEGSTSEVSLPYEKVVSEISVSLINTSAVEIEQEITAALELVREVFGFDGFGLVSVLRDNAELIHFVHSDQMDGLPERMDYGLFFPSLGKSGYGGGTVAFSSLSDLPGEARVDRQTCLNLGISAGLLLPILVAGSVRYFLIGLHVVPRYIETEHIPRLRVVGEMCANALVRCESEAARSKSALEIERLQGKLQDEAELLQSDHICTFQGHDEIVGQSEKLLKTLAMTEQVAPTDATVLIYGETGTGKELIAQEIHKLSLRRKKQLVKVNCASLPAALVESELFGREKGAYTGALTRQAGRFELADGGTIFLDEIAEMSLELQVKLLRVLQEGQFERLGSTKSINVNVRVIAATNRNLSEEVKKGTFREDLFYRLNVFQIVVPPLRERVDDIPLLVWGFVNQFSEKMGKQINKISKQDMAALQSYPWPGNVRELRNVIEHAAIISTSDTLQVRVPEIKQEELHRIQTLDEYEAMHIREALRMTAGRIKGEAGAAKLLGLNPSTLYSRMQRLGIAPRPPKDGISP